MRQHPPLINRRILRMAKGIALYHPPEQATTLLY
jgi:hypothetical protein